MVCEDGIANTDVTCNTLVETSFGKDAIGGRQMLFPIESLFFQAIELRVGSDLQFSAVLGSAHCAMGAVSLILRLESA